MENSALTGALPRTEYSTEYAPPPRFRGIYPAAAPDPVDLTSLSAGSEVDQPARCATTWQKALLVGAGTLAVVNSIPGPAPAVTTVVLTQDTSSVPLHDKPVIYLASPLGFSEATRSYYNDKVIPAVKAAGFEVIDPWQGGQAIEQALKILDPQLRREKLAQADLEVALKNKRSIERADAVLAILDGTDVDSGTASEVGYAAALGKQIYGYRGDFRLSSENEGTRVNLQVEGFIRSSGGSMSSTLEDARQQLEGYARNYQARVEASRHPTGP